MNGIVIVILFSQYCNSFCIICLDFGLENRDWKGQILSLAACIESLDASVKGNVTSLVRFAILQLLKWSESTQIFLFIYCVIDESTQNMIKCKMAVLVKLLFSLISLGNVIQWLNINTLNFHFLLASIFEIGFDISLVSLDLLSYS